MAESKALTKDNMRTAGANGVDLISRLPRTFNLADALAERVLETDLAEWASWGPFSARDDSACYRLKSYETTLTEQDVRGIVVHSLSLAEQKDASVEVDVESTEETLEEDIDDLEALWFACEPDAEESHTGWLDDHDEAVF